MIEGRPVIGPDTEILGGVFLSRGAILVELVPEEDLTFEDMTRLAAYEKRLRQAG